MLVLITPQGQELLFNIPEDEAVALQKPADRPLRKDLLRSQFNRAVNKIGAAYLQLVSGLIQTATFNPSAGNVTRAKKIELDLQLKDKLTQEDRQALLAFDYPTSLAQYVEVA